MSKTSRVALPSTLCC